MACRVRTVSNKNVTHHRKNSHRFSASLFLHAGALEGFGRGFGLRKSYELRHLVLADSHRGLWYTDRSPGSFTHSLSVYVHLLHWSRNCNEAMCLSSDALFLSSHSASSRNMEANPGRPRECIRIHHFSIARTRSHPSEYAAASRQRRRACAVSVTTRQ